MAEWPRPSRQKCTGCHKFCPLPIKPEKWEHGQNNRPTYPVGHCAISVSTVSFLSSFPSLRTSPLAISYVSTPFFLFFLRHLYPRFGNERERKEGRGRERPQRRAGRVGIEQSRGVKYVPLMKLQYLPRPNYRTVE